LIGARQGGGGLVLAEAAARHGFMLQAFGQGAQQRLAPLPVVQRRLQGRRDQEGVREPVQVIRDDDEAAVTAVLERGEFHELKLIRSRAGGKSARGAQARQTVWTPGGLMTARASAPVRLAGSRTSTSMMMAPTGSCAHR